MIFAGRENKSNRFLINLCYFKLFLIYILIYSCKYYLSPKGSIYHLPDPTFLFKKKPMHIIRYIFLLPLLWASICEILPTV